MKACKYITLVFIYSLFYQFSISQIKEISGYWKEEIEVEFAKEKSEETHQKELVFSNVLHLEKKENKLVGKLNMMQSHGLINKIPINEIILKNDSLFFDIEEFSIRFKGHFNRGKKTIEGVVSLNDGSKVSTSYKSISKQEFIKLGEGFMVKQDTDLYKYKPPLKTDDGWEISTLEKENISLSGIETVVNNIKQGKHGTINSFLIVKNSKLVLDEYFYGYNINDLHFLSSATKSVASIITGIAYTKGYIKDLNSSIFEYLPNCNKYKTRENSKITLHHLLSNQLGFEQAKNSYPIEKDIFEYTLTRKMLNKAGEQFMYDNIAPNILAGIVKNSTGLHIDKFAQKHLFTPLQIRNIDWEDNKQNNYPICQGTLNIRSRDFAKLGYLILKDGQWDKKQIISEKWVKKAKNVNAVVNEEQAVYYGYLFWIADFSVDGEKYRVIYAGGSGGQYMFIIPKLDAIVLFTGNNFNNHKEFELFDILETQLLKCLKGK